MKEVISDSELYACPINETVKVLYFGIALNILRMDVHALETSFLTSMHREMVNQMLQRQSMAEFVLFSPNICAELFTVHQYKENVRYIVNKLIGRYDYSGIRIHDFLLLERQTWRKIYKMIEGKEDSSLIFFWDREPNIVEPVDDKCSEWRFTSDSPAYKTLLDFYGKNKLVKRT